MLKTNRDINQKDFKIFNLRFVNTMYGSLYENTGPDVATTDTDCPDTRQVHNTRSLQRLSNDQRSPTG